MSYADRIKAWGENLFVQYSSGLDALRACDAPMIISSTDNITYHEIPALGEPWTCRYCGCMNSASALYCGGDGVAHCGAPKPQSLQDDCDEDDYDDFQRSHRVISLPTKRDISTGDVLYVMPDGYVTNDLPEDQCFPTLGQAIKAASAGSVVIVGM
jgi:hypothetical protein